MNLVNTSVRKPPLKVESLIADRIWPRDTRVYRHERGLSSCEWGNDELNEHSAVYFSFFLSQFFPFFTVSSQDADDAHRVINTQVHRLCSYVRCLWCSSDTYTLLQSIKCKCKCCARVKVLFSNDLSLHSMHSGVNYYLLACHELGTSSSSPDSLVMSHMSVLENVKKRAHRSFSPPQVSRSSEHEDETTGIRVVNNLFSKKQDATHSRRINRELHSIIDHSLLQELRWLRGQSDFRGQLGQCSREVSQVERIGATSPSLLRGQVQRCAWHLESSFPGRLWIRLC